MNHGFRKKKYKKFIFDQFIKEKRISAPGAHSQYFEKISHFRELLRAVSQSIFELESVHLKN